VKQVCSACNNGWMAALEDRARPILVGMLDGRACTLDYEAQQTLAAWAAKTLAVCDLALGEPSLGQAARERLRSEPVPDGCAFLLARYSGSRFPLHAGRWVRPVDMDIGGRRQSRRVGLFSVSFGSVVLQLFAHGLPDATLAPVGKKGDFARVVWPVQGPCWWPLPVALGDDGLRTFMREL
jgi:hypothetical protein